jgi:hypothetical protein
MRHLNVPINDLLGTFDSAASFLSDTVYQRNTDIRYQICNILLARRYTGVAAGLLYINGKFTMGKLK